MRSLAASLMFAMFASTAISGQGDRIRVYVSTAQPAGGFVDQDSKHRETTKKELASELKGKKKTIEVVDTAERADILIEVKSAGYADGAIETRANVLGGGVSSSPKKEYRAVVSLTVGEYSTDMTVQRGAFSTLAASRLADDIEKWIKDNRERVLAARK